jgi:CHASE3 domain sensor protein
MGTELNGTAARASRIIGTALLALLLVVGMLTWRLSTAARSARTEVAQTYRVIMDMQTLFSMLQDAESSQRGFLLTGNAGLLAPYEAAAGQVPPLLDDLPDLLGGTPGQRERAERLIPLVRRKLDHIAEAVRLGRAGQFDAAREQVANGSGKSDMDGVRHLVGEIESAEQHQLEARTAAAQRAETLTIIGTLATVAMLIAVLAGAAILLRRAFASVRSRC